MKPANILYEDKSRDSRLKIADFGFATFKEEQQVLLTMCGTPVFVAPEVKRERERVYVRERESRANQKEKIEEKEEK